MLAGDSVCVEFHRASMSGVGIAKSTSGRGVPLRPTGCISHHPRPKSVSMRENVLQVRSRAVADGLNCPAFRRRICTRRPGTARAPRMGAMSGCFLTVPQAGVCARLPEPGLARCMVSLAA